MDNVISYGVCDDLFTMVDYKMSFARYWCKIKGHTIIYPRDPFGLARFILPYCSRCGLKMPYPRYTPDGLLKNEPDGILTEISWKGNLK